MRKCCSYPVWQSPKRECSGHGRALCRYGGEEFALICHSAALRESVAIAERLQEIIRCNQLTFGTETLRVTASFGVAVFRFNDECTVGGFLNRADRLLY
ncbi:hypothetical protein SBDP2_500007 [Syntrophobacter sp. SbD2]|nr:hypothetical protein SBDP2_500007 [Syntrophobacter sp. SbD2]